MSSSKHTTLQFKRPHLLHWWASLPLLSVCKTRFSATSDGRVYCTAIQPLQYSPSNTALAIQPFSYCNTALSLVTHYLNLIYGAVLYSYGSEEVVNPHLSFISIAIFIQCWCKERSTLIPDISASEPVSQIGSVSVSVASESIETDWKIT